MDDANDHRIDDESDDESVDAAEALVTGPRKRAWTTARSAVRSSTRSVRDVASTLVGFGYDAVRYLRWSPLSGPPRSVDHLDAYVTMEYHALEKGMALPEPRPGFGRQHVRSLISLIRTSSERHGWRPVTLQALSVLRAYQASQPDGYGDPAIDRLLASAPAAEEAGDEAAGGTRTVSRNDVLRDARIDLSAFLASRSSVRDFTGEPVDPASIEQAVRMARTTPSVSNRQAWRVYLLSDPGAIAAALRHQNGNRGFGDRIDKLVIVTSDLTRFANAGERFQCWIDGGMFSMTLVYALHSLGLGTCCLNMSSTRAQDRGLRRDVAIRPNDTVIMMIAVGNLPDTYRVTESPDRPIEDLLEVL